MCVSRTPLAGGLRPPPDLSVRPRSSQFSTLPLLGFKVLKIVKGLKDNWIGNRQSAIDNRESKELASTVYTTFNTLKKTNEGALRKRTSATGPEVRAAAGGRRGTRRG